eukprot:6212581-Pleurochrysis_carterae.AAC.10
MCVAAVIYILLFAYCRRPILAALRALSVVCFYLSAPSIVMLGLTPRSFGFIPQFVAFHPAAPASRACSVPRSTTHHSADETACACAPPRRTLAVAYA